MHKHPSVALYVDHHLQAALLSRLVDANGPVRFTDLKEDGIENSLFMYHVNKLISRGIIEKSDDGFLLTPNGAHWVNFVGPNMMSATPTVRPLVELIIQGENNTILLSTRKGQLREQLNDYMLPGGLHKIGMTAGENAKRILSRLYPGLEAAPVFLATVENISRYSDGFIYHSFAHIYTVDIPSRELPGEDDRYAFEWMPMTSIRVNNPIFKKSMFVSRLMQKVQDDTLEPREVIEIEYS